MKEIKDDKQMERYSMFLSRKNQYCENDYTDILLWGMVFLCLLIKSLMFELLLMGQASAEHLVSTITPSFKKILIWLCWVLVPAHRTF